MGPTISFLLRCPQMPAAQHRAARTHAFQARIEVNGVAPAA